MLMTKKISEKLNDNNQLVDGWLKKRSRKNTELFKYCTLYKEKLYV